MNRPFRTLPMSLAILAAALAACDRRPDGSPAAPAATSVVVYCSVDAAFAEPILADFARRTGIKVHHVFDTEAGKTTGLVNKLLAERDRPRADVWWSSEVFGTMQLAAAGVLAPYEPPTASDVLPPFRDAAGRWTAFGVRGRVIAYDPRRTSARRVPRRWADVAAAPVAARFAMADPRFGTTRGHMATLLELWGESALREHLHRLRRHGVRLTDGNSQSVMLVVRGLVDFAATDTDDVIVAQTRGDSVDMVYPDLDSPDGMRPLPGTLWIPCSAGLVAGAVHPDAGRRLVDYLVSAEVEERLARSESRNVPVRPAVRERLGIAAPAVAPVDYAAAASKLEAADRLVREALLP